MSTERPVESVWDYPRPPAVDASGETVEVHLDGRCIARTGSPLRVLETSHPPTYYLPRSAFERGVLVPVPGTTFCEFKGEAAYFDVVVDEARAPRAAWLYPHPSPGYERLADHVGVMPGAMQGCYVDGERVTPQEGSFYGGWITSRVTGPFKGAPGTLHW
ncbi:DUF427 domain-containing protein [Luteipulveratus flavus]|uniref:DUF427 domain-containing protein n=1 Tax=Luteipulveratus flavus TaxID=3031728 RepID=A0ABT6CBM0_9MICO|nr:DUF427 domain-containing protein [Luteipulveratus sp. YIM 133296]MDF8266302.1 DUF427 domain-containing protein [Luteipulveratus sp. YIM 133296]